MAGNSRRQGAIRKPESKKDRDVGSGGQRRRGLTGKGPTPKAKDRTGHVASKRSGKAGRDQNRSRSGAGVERSGELVLGRNAVLEALEAGIPARELLLAEGLDHDKRLKQIMTLANQCGLRIREIRREEMADRAGSIVHQGVALLAAPYEYVPMSDLLVRNSQTAPGLVVMLDGVTDPRNLGAIARSALAFGGTGLVVPSRRSVGVTPAAWRTSAGALANIPVAQVTNLVREIKAAKDHGFTVVGITGDAHQSIEAVPYENDPILLIVGGESTGLGRLVTENCDFVAKIQMSHKVESLNASVAASITLHEIDRARRA